MLKGYMTVRPTTPDFYFLFQKNIIAHPSILAGEVMTDNVL
jgi:hypothetical protein